MVTRVGVVGTGFVSRHFAGTLRWHEGFEISRVLTRRPLNSVEYPFYGVLTNSLHELLDSSDLVFECSGDPIYAHDVVAAAVSAAIPVVTLNAEFHVTSGSHFAGSGLVSEAEGDQPGSLAALNEETVGMGFKPIVFGNMKGFLNEDPSPEDMRVWSQRQGLSIEMTTSFTDGTKVQIEQALVANGLGADIAKDGLLGPSVDTLKEAAQVLGREAHIVGVPISDYVLSSALPHGVFIVAEHDPEHEAALAYFKLGDGPLYVLQKPNIMVHLEVMKTIERMVGGRKPLLVNSSHPTIGVGAITKRQMESGEIIENGIGSFATRGVAIKLKDHRGHVPIGLLRHARIARKVPEGELLSMSDVELDDSNALQAWQAIEDAAFDA